MIVWRRIRMLDEVGMNSGVFTWLRSAAAAVAVVVVVPLLAPCGAVAVGSSHLTPTTLELSTIDSINALRVANGVEPLMISPALFGSATLHCEQMVEGGYFAHTNPDGSGFGSRVASFYPQGSHRYYSVAENLL